MISSQKPWPPDHEAGQGTANIWGTTLKSGSQQVSLDRPALNHIQEVFALTLFRLQYWVTTSSATQYNGITTNNNNNNRCSNRNPNPGNARPRSGQQNLSTPKHNNAKRRPSVRKIWLVIRFPKPPNYYNEEEDSLNDLKTKINLNFIKRFSSYSALTWYSHTAVL